MSVQPSSASDPVAQKWRALAERRRAHFVELYRSGRWKHYYTRDQFVARLRDVFDAADVWAKLAPKVEGGQHPRPLLPG